MSFRITQGMLYSRAYSDIQSGLFRSAQLQREIASGRRISRPSDDPAAALRILPLRNDLRSLDQMTQNAALARETLNTSTRSLEDASELMQRVRELTTQAANGTLTNDARASIAAEVDQLLSQLVGIGNSRRGDRYLFAGTANGEAPFELTTDAGGSRVTYRGNRESLGVDVAPGVSTDLNVPGDRIFLLRDRSGTTLTPSLGQAATGAVAIGDGDTGVGFGRFAVTYAGLHTDAPSTVTAGTGATNAIGPLDFVFTTAPDTLSVGGGPAMPVPATNGTFTTSDGRVISLTVSGVPTSTTGTFTARAGLSTDGGVTVTEISDFNSDVQVVDSFSGGVLNVDVQGLLRTGTEEVKYEGTFDAFTTLVALRDLLQNDAARPDAAVRDRIAALITEVDAAHDAVLDGLRELGFRSSSMDVLRNRVEGMVLSQTESLSMVQDTDMAESVLALQRQELSFQAALQISARVIQTSLQAFLR